MGMEEVLHDNEVQLFYLASLDVLDLDRIYAFLSADYGS